MKTLHRMRAARYAPWRVAVCALFLYTLWLLLYRATGHQPRDFIVIGLERLRAGHGSALIVVDPHYRYDSADPHGYDGQYCYFIALDPARAAPYMDWPAYRYGRILYPLLARALAFAQPLLIPYTLIIVNWFAIGAGALAVAAVLQRRGRSPWLALLYACSTGMFIAFQGDLTEPLAFAFTAAAIYCYSYGPTRLTCRRPASGRSCAPRRTRLLLAGALFGLAGLTRETTLVFAGVYALAALLARDVAPPNPDAVLAEAAPMGTAGATGAMGAAAQRARLGQRILANWRSAALLFTCAVAPLLAWKLFLWVWLGDPGAPAAVRFQALPFSGLLVYWPLSGLRVIELEGVVAPGLLVGALALIALARGARHVELWALLANVLLFIVFLPASSYVDILASARIGAGVVLAALLCIPHFDALTRRNRWWLIACAALWLAFLPAQAIGFLLSH